jgi:hypothetical protein
MDANITIDQLGPAERAIMDALRAGLKEDERLRSVSFGTTVVFPDFPGLSVGTTRVEPLGSSVSVAEEAPSTQSSESTSSQESFVQNGGDRISGSRSETTTDE